MPDIRLRGASCGGVTGQCGGVSVGELWFVAACYDFALGSCRRDVRTIPVQGGNSGWPEIPPALIARSRSFVSTWAEAVDEASRIRNRRARGSKSLECSERQSAAV